LGKPSDLIVIGTLTAGVAAAAFIDLKTRRVPNALTGLLALSGIVFATFGIGHLTVGAAVLGLLLGLALMLPGHLFGATGAGDVKLFAAMGSLLGPAPIVGAFFYTALAGGVLAAIVAIRRRRLRQSLGAAARLVASGGANAAEIEKVGEPNRFAYAPAIAVGSILSAIGATGM
jgi:prepilin peptidase CpaA